MFWDRENVELDDIKSKYSPLFAELNIHDPKDIAKSVNYFHDISKNLVDNHFQINFLVSPVRGRIIFPSSERKLSDIGIIFPYTDVVCNYLDPGYKLSHFSLFSASNDKLDLLTGLINGNIIYLRFNAFNIQRAINSSEEINQTFQQFLAYLKETQFKPYALVIDVRQNRGGDLSDLSFLAGYIVAKDVKFGYYRTKNGANPLDYTEWIDARLLARNSIAPNISKIVLLTDRNTASAAESLIFYFKSFPNTTIIGETTWGATGLLTDPNMFNTGNFELPGFMSVQMTSVSFKYLDGRSYENQGIEPNLVIPTDVKSLKAGKDPQIEAAIKFINSSN